MRPPHLIAEVVSPGRSNRDRDYINKRAQYAAIGVSEYWLIDPTAKAAMVLQLQGDDYAEVGTFQGGDSLRDGKAERIISPEFPNLTLTAAQVFQR